eukprot:18736-Heterococcus_DN1.PRE.8
MQRNSTRHILRAHVATAAARCTNSQLQLLVSDLSRPVCTHKLHCSYYYNYCYRSCTGTQQLW